MAKRFLVLDTVTLKTEALTDAAFQAAAIDAAQFEVVDLVNGAGTIVVKGTVVYISGDMTFSRARANAVGTCSGMVGIVDDATIGVGATGKVRLNGLMTFSAAELQACTQGALSSLTPGVQLVVSTLTAGLWTPLSGAGVPANPGECLVYLGVAMGDREITVEPQFFAELA